MSYVIQFEKTPTIFLKKRLARIYPPYWQIYFLAILAWIILRGIFHIKFMARGSWFVNMSLMPWEFNKDKEGMVLQVAWTLYYEMVFYIVVTASLYFFKKKPKFGVYLLFMLMCCFPKYPLFFTFIIGFCWMEWIKTKERIDLVTILSCLGIVHLERVGGELGWLVCVATLLVIYAEKFLPHFKMLEALGDCSYSLYLIHLPLLGIVNWLVGFNHYPMMIVVVGDLLIIFFAYLNYEFFEKKIAVKLRRFITK